ncbi:hypothetical protein F5Y11DRAFT_304475 [Daldinia sp. FL1419]|nr:hypothetical protein F5Y11DRAFT_304475 [Daldinia sp. FL1419]
MERPTLLQAPKSGRSRFSKALPAPPPELENDRPEIVPQEALPSVYSPFPPRQDSVSARSISSPKSPKPSLNSPLPALPPANAMGAPNIQTQMRSIPRKPVGLPANPAPTADAKTKKMRRVSSISSLLSAYSNTSSDSVQRSSQGSIFTKDSEPSNSPEREGINDIQPSLTKTLTALPSNPYGDEARKMSDETMTADLPPPPPPLKDPFRPSTPPRVRPVDPFPALPASESGTHNRGPSASPSDLDGDSPRRREIWRRRASSKSDHGLLVPELKLAGSHGSTASTAQPANPDPLPPPPPTQINNATSPLPPRSTSLPGRNIRPSKQTEPQRDDKMRKLSAKLKELTGRGDSTKSPEKAKEEPVEKGEHIGGLQSRAQYEDKTNVNPAPPAKDQLGAEDSAVPKASVETVVHAPIRLGPPSEALPKESVEKPISRRAVGAPVPRSQPEVHKKGSSSDLRQPGVGLPRYPRPSQSNPALRSPSSLRSAQEMMRPKASPQSSSPVAMPLALPPDADELSKKPDFFNMATALNETTLSSDISSRKPTRKFSKDVDTSALSDIGESVEHMTAEQTAQVNEALSRFPRNYNLAAPSTDAIWKATPISSRHYNCYVHHDKWLPVKNSNYPLACQTCGIEDTGSRKICSWCNLRICVGCHERLIGPYKSNLKLLMDNMEVDQRREKGKQAAGS